MSKEYVHKLRDFDYCSLYSVNGDIDLPFDRRICFADVFRKYNIHDAHYVLKLIRDPAYNEATGKNNICLLTKQELQRHLKLARRLFPFKYSVQESEYNEYAAFEVTIDIALNSIYHKYLLTWIRYAYELPYNIILNEALRMKHTYLRKESITNLYILCANSFTCSCFSYGSGHAIAYPFSAFLKESELIAQLTSCNSLNSIYPRARQDVLKIPIPAEEIDKFLEYWLDEEEFNQRARIYITNYKQMIKK